MSDIEHYMRAVSRLRNSLVEIKEELAVIADEALDGDTAEKIDSVRARISNVLDGWS